MMSADGIQTDWWRGIRRPLFDALIDAGPNTPPRAVVDDEGYNSDASRGVRSVPSLASAPLQPKGWPGSLRRCALPGSPRIEQIVGRLERFERVALKCKKTKRNFRSIISLAAAFVFVRFLDTPEL